jgi:hypothetical protein
MGEVILLDNLRRKRERIREEEKVKARLLVEAHGKPSAYVPNDLLVQAGLLRKYLGAVGWADISVASHPLPKGAEGWFAIPRWENVASTYCGAVEKVFTALMKARKGNFFNYHEGMLSSLFLRESKYAEEYWARVRTAQPERGILVVAAQFGMRYRYRSVREARWAMQKNEFGLGAFAIGCMLLTHPKRLQRWDDLWIDCPGDKVGGAECNGPLFTAQDDCDVEPLKVPYFRFISNTLEFKCGEDRFVSSSFGSASVFI